MRKSFSFLRQFPLNREQQHLTIPKRCFLSAVNVLTKTPRISNLNKGDIFQITFCQSDEKICKKCFHADFTSVWDPSTCWLSKKILKRRFLESSLTKSLRVCSFRNTLAMTIFFFLKILKIGWRFQKKKKKWRGTFSFLR